MKTIQISKLDLINFKGIRDLHVEFLGDNAYIYGANGSGKTSIFDAFTWLLFGKDSAGRSDFNVKTLDAHNAVIPKLDHEVAAEIIANGDRISLRRILKENWQKKKGSTVAEFTGNTTEYYWNGVPMQAKEYQRNISELLDETVFKLITNTLAFNSLGWQERRGILTRMATVSDAEIAAGNSAFLDLMEQIKGQKSLEDFKKMKLASISKAKDQLKTIPTRIDEVTRMKPQAENFAVIREELSEKEIQLKHIDDQIQDSTKAVDDVIKKRNDHALAISNLKTDIAKIESAATNESNKQLNESKKDFTAKQFKLSEVKTELAQAKSSLEVIVKNISTWQEEIKQKEAIIVSKREQWATENAKELMIDPAATCCPACKRELDGSDLEAKQSELKANFQKNKDSVLASIRSEGTQLGDRVKYLQGEVATSEKIRLNTEERIKALEVSIDLLTKELEQLQTDPAADERKLESIYDSILSMNSEYISKKSELADMEKITIDVPVVNNDGLKSQRSSILQEIDTLKNRLRAEEQIKSAEQRIDALNKEEQDLAQQIADVEKIVATIDDFNKAKMDAIEERVNQKFKLVRWKMFEKQINGGESECCEATVNGVPFSDVNTASRINAGIDIINTLSEFYQVNAPIFVDNRESVVELLPTNSQLINLVVSPQDKVLRVA